MNVYSPQQEEVLDAIRGNADRGYYSASHTIWGAAQRTGYPEASVRRTIQELRRLGHEISYSNGLYRYHGLRQTAAA